MIEQIFLIGYRAAGKTTIGKLLANRLGFEFLDTDRIVCRNHNAEIRDIVAGEGWEAFRRYEAEALGEAAKGRRRVVATGGGAVLHREVWQKIKDEAFVVWLSADLPTLAARLQSSGNADVARPSLTGRSIHAEIEEVLAKRLPLYREYSNLEVDTTKLSAVEAVELIVDAYRLKYVGSGR